MVSNIRSALNGARSPASKLPPEVLSQIFACLRTPEIPTQYHPLEDMWATFNESLAAVNLVCRYWRQAAIGAKVLWTHVAAVDTVDFERLRLMFELFLKRSDSYPLSLTIPRTDDYDHYSRTFHMMEPFVHRLQTLVIGRPGIGPSGFHFFSQPAPLLEELKLVCLPAKTLPTLFEGFTPRLRTLDLVECVPEPTDRFYNLSTLALGPSKIEDFDNLLFMLEDSPRLEHLYLQQSLVRSPEEPYVAVLSRSAKVHHLKTLSLSRFSAEEIYTLLLSLSLPQHNLALRFVDIRSKDQNFSHIYPPDFPPHSSIFTATSLEIQITPFFCAFHAVGRHAATAIQWHPGGSYLSTSAVMRHVAQGPFGLVKELWVPSHTGGTNIPLAFPALELLVVGREGTFAVGFSGMLAPREGEVPSPRLVTIEIRGHLNHVLAAEFATALHDRANAGCRLKKLRIKRRDEEVSLLPLEYEVDELELLDELGGGMELPEICKTDLGERWLSWRRDPSEHQAWSW